MQIETAKLKAENRALKSKDTSKLVGRTISSASSVAAVTDQDKVLHREYRGIGKRFAILSELWVRRSILRRPCPPDPEQLGPWNRKRCANDATWDNGNVTELYFLLPEPYHDLIEHSALFSDMVRGQSFRSTNDLNFPKFMKGAKQMRSYLIDTVRKHASVIFSIESAADSKYYSAKYDRSMMPVFSNLLKSPKNPNEEYPTYPRVLFTNYQVIEEELFGSHAILNVS